jgi:hypothetical protein
MISQAPPPELRYIGIKQAASILRQKVFVTIEPILDFDAPELIEWIRQIKPEFVNIGADSKGCGLVEPPWGKVEKLIAGLTETGIAIRKKSNLARLERDKA